MQLHLSTVVEGGQRNSVLLLRAAHHGPSWLTGLTPSGRAQVQHWEVSSPREVGALVTMEMCQAVPEPSPLAPGTGDLSEHTFPCGSCTVFSACSLLSPLPQALAESHSPVGGMRLFICPATCTVLFSYLHRDLLSYLHSCESVGGRETWGQRLAPFMTGFFCPSTQHSSGH